MNFHLAEKVRSMAIIDTFSKSDFILKEGQVCNKACFIVKGLTRSYYLREGIEITSRFMEEGNIVTSWPSYYTQKKGNEFIQALEKTVLACLTYSDIQKLYFEFPDFNIIGRKQVEYAFYQSELRTQMLRKHTAEEKYYFFTTHHPSLLQRVSLKHIATYLGMTEETLSRVRSHYHKSK